MLLLSNLAQGVTFANVLETFLILLFYFENLYSLLVLLL